MKANENNFEGFEALGQKGLIKFLMSGGIMCSKNKMKVHSMLTCIQYNRCNTFLIDEMRKFDKDPTITKEKINRIVCN